MNSSSRELAHAASGVREPAEFERVGSFIRRTADNRLLTPTAAREVYRQMQTAAVHIAATDPCAARRGYRRAEALKALLDAPTASPAGETVTDPGRTNP